MRAAPITFPIRRVGGVSDYLEEYGGAIVSVILILLVIGVVFGLYTIFSNLNVTVGDQTVPLIPGQITNIANQALNIMTSLLMVIIVFVALLPLVLWLWNFIKARRVV